MSTETNESTTSRKSAKISMSEQFPIKVLCDFISPYKGERDTLTAFLTNCQNALDLASPSQTVLLTKYILSRLEGKAQIACSNKIFEDFNQLKCFLKQNFGERKHYNHLLLDLQSCKQLPNETVAQFSLRIESCLTDLQSEIYNSESLKREICRNPKSLNDAINVALEEEKIQNLLYKTSIKPKCRICGKPGHSDSECREKQKRTGPPHVPSDPQPSTLFNNSGSQLFCKYCKNKGHDITQCRKRKYNNERRNTFNPHTRDRPATMNHITFEPPMPSAPSPTPYYNTCENDDDHNNSLN
ncbi:hypothetical protein SFRURICE_020761 [Spodoptera frugiperda]|nr:hypothetical protein SFRURICE_020761 [Spodoptera frugiperda]